jgi:hypothetical protein
MRRPPNFAVYGGEAIARRSRSAVVEPVVVSSPEPPPQRVALKDPFGSFGKVVGAVAGAGVFVYLIGVVVLWERLASAHLPAREVIAVIPREQVAVLGAREVFVSAIAGVFSALFLYAFYRLFRVSERAVAAGGGRGRLLHRMREHPAAVVTAVVAVLGVAAPCDVRGVVLFVVFLANTYLGVRSAHRSLIGELPDFRTSLRPWLRVVAGLAIAVFIISLERQHAFPERFSVARIYGSGPSDNRYLYLGSTGNAIVLGRPTALKGPRCPIRSHRPPKMLEVPYSGFKRITLTNGPRPCRAPSSILRFLGLAKIECIAVICEYGDHRFGLEAAP